MVVEFNTRKGEVLQKKIDRFNELKVKYFMDNLNDKEEIEFNNIEKWLKIHS